MSILGLLDNLFHIHRFDFHRRGLGTATLQGGFWGLEERTVSGVCTVVRCRCGLLKAFFSTSSERFEVDPDYALAVLDSIHANSRNDENGVESGDGPRPV